MPMTKHHDEKAPAVAALPPGSPVAISALARSLNELLVARPAHELDDILAAQAIKLDTLFHHLLLKNAGGAQYNEAFGLATALRAQKQCRHTIETINARRERLWARDEK